MNKNLFQIHKKPFWDQVLEELWSTRTFKNEDARARAFYQTIKLMFVPEHLKRRGLGFEQRLVSMRMNLKKVDPVPNKKKYDFVVKELNEKFEALNKSVEEDIKSYAEKVRISTFTPSLIQGSANYTMYRFFRTSVDSKLGYVQKIQDVGWAVRDFFNEKGNTPEPFKSNLDYEYEESFDVETTLEYLLDRALKCTHNSQVGCIWDRKATDAVKAIKSAIKKLPRELEVKYNEGAELKYYKQKRTYNDFK